MRRVYDPVKEDDECTIRNNQMVDELLKHENIVRFVKTQRIECLVYLERMDDQRKSKKILRAQVY